MRAELAVSSVNHGSTQNAKWVNPSRKSTLFVRLAQPHKHFEAISSRPLLLHGVATQTRHAGQTRLTITSTHAKQSAIQAVLTNLASFLASLKATAEQLTDTHRLQAILARASAKFMLATGDPPTSLSAQRGQI